MSSCLRRRLLSDQTTVCQHNLRVSHLSVQSWSMPMVRCVCVRLSNDISKLGETSPPRDRAPRS